MLSVLTLAPFIDFFNSGNFKYLRLILLFQRVANHILSIYLNGFLKFSENDSRFPNFF